MRHCERAPRKRKAASRMSAEVEGDADERWQKMISLGFRCAPLDFRCRTNELTAGKVAANLESPRSRIYRNSPVEPCVGQEFESEAEAHVFYNAYATSVGFIVRVSKLSRSRIDNSTIGRIFVCNKEGYRMTDKRENVIRQRAETRVGCKAMIMVRKVKSVSWVVTCFVKEHTHPLAGPGGGRRDFIYEQYPGEWDRIRELNQQLTAEKKRSVTYKRHLEVEHIDVDEYNETLLKKIQHIVDNVKEMESKEEQSQLNFQSATL
ncbi:protein FAR1-RELATED SEQUENCE 1-like [Arachis stenosperma]|uniref:protein FAR1-RELATED SEQUENCE 1-like n=1 Tax=Arachis stenosperma TaxID=217475 RepID=UPI0025AB8753|nr:protein FAR1-RELATED SEQUENCE 1-like [Arachis stenosperma]